MTEREREQNFVKLRAEAVKLRAEAVKMRAEVATLTARAEAAAATCSAATNCSIDAGTNLYLAEQTIAAQAETIAEKESINEGLRAMSAEANQYNLAYRTTIERQAETIATQERELDRWRQCAPTLESAVTAALPVCRDALATFGADSQIRIAVEECAELIVSLLHSVRGRETPAVVQTEIADVLIVALQMAEMFGTAEVAHEMSEKLGRLRARIERQRKKEAVIR